MTGRSRMLIAAFLLNTVAGGAWAGDILVDKAAPENVNPRFFERIEAGKLANAVARRGQVVHMAPGTYHMRVPCDHSKVSNVNDVTVTIKNGTLTRVRMLDCGVELRVKTVFRAG